MPRSDLHSSLPQHACSAIAKASVEHLHWRPFFAALVLFVLTLFTSAASSAAPAEGSTVTRTRAVFYRPTMVDDDSGRVQVGTAATSQALVMRLADTSGTPLANIAVEPLIVTQPEGVRKAMTIFPARGITNSAGEFRFEVSPGDKSGRYVVLFVPSSEMPSGLKTFPQFELLVHDPNWPSMLLFSLAGGLGLFLYGLHRASASVEEYAGKRMRVAMAEMTRNPLSGLLLGIVITFFTQSSGATTVMLMSFARAKVLTFRQSLGVLLGAAIGGTITVQLISFNLFDYALPAVGVGFLGGLLAQKPRTKAITRALMGFGMAFYGMKIMTGLMSDLKAFPFFVQAIHALGDYPIWAIIISSLFTALAQSSGATLGIVVALGRQELVTLEQAVPLFMGAGLGISFVGIVGSFGATSEARRIGLAHLLYKLAAVVLCLPLMDIIAALGREFTALFTPVYPPGEFSARAIANTYMLFIIITALGALTVISVLERACMRLVPDDPENGMIGEVRAKYLDLQVVDTPSVALGLVLREISRMGRFVEEMMREYPRALFDRDDKAALFVQERDDKVDALYDDITLFLTRITQKSGDDQDAVNRATDLLYIVSDLESIGDILDKDLVRVARKAAREDVVFPTEDHNDILQLIERVSKRLATMVVALTTNDRHLAMPIVTEFAGVQEFGKKLHLRHLERLRHSESILPEASSAHLDVINLLLRIDYLIYDISLHICGDAATAPIMRLESQSEA